MAQSQKPALNESQLKEIMNDYIPPDLPAKCTWHKDADPNSSPHTSYRNVPKGLLYPNILDTIGHTPIVKLNKIPQSLGIKCDIYVKCEFVNPGGSIKDRIAVRMIEDAERDGRLQPGGTIIEPTSGNTGIGLALVATVKNYRCIIIVPEKTSKEKVDILKVLGAEVILIPMGVPFNAPNGIVGMAHVLNKQIPNSVVLSQFRNASNPMVHYDCTAEEILEAFNGKIDMFVAGNGTGGTLSGVARKMKQACPSCIIVGADAEGSKMAAPEALNNFNCPFVEVEGFNYAFVPTTLDRPNIDWWLKCKDVDSYAMTRRLIREEGILSGASGGFNVNAALIAAKDLKEGQVCVVVIPDDTKNYVTTLASDQWLEAKNLQPCINHQNHSWWDVKVSQLHLQRPMTIESSVSCEEAMKIMTAHNLNEMPIIENGILIGMVTTRILTQKLMSRFVGPSDEVKKAGTMMYLKVTPNCNLGLVSRIMEIEQYVLVTEMTPTKEEVVGIITNLDFLRFISTV